MLRLIQSDFKNTRNYLMDLFKGDYCYEDNCMGLKKMLSYDYNSDEVFPFGLFNIESEEQIPLYFVDINGKIVDQFAKI